MSRAEMLQEDPQATIDHIDIDLLTVGEVIGRTEHSLIQTCVYNGKQMVLKRTLGHLGDSETLNLLMRVATAPIGGWAKTVRSGVGIPRGLWTADGYIWELQEYYEGICLGDIVLRNQQPLDGEFLRICVQWLVDILFELARTGIVHRDISPFNLFLTYSGKLILLDWSFCTRPSIQSPPVMTVGYTAPEQERGRPTPASDWYSFAATLYFLCNGTRPPERGSPQYVEGISKIDAGTYRFDYWRSDGQWAYSLRNLCDGLLAPNPDDRPIPTRIEWVPVSYPGGPFSESRAFDLGRGNHLILTCSYFWVVPAQVEALRAKWAPHEFDFIPAEVERVVRSYHPVWPNAES